MTKHVPTLLTERLQLRPPRPEDGHAAADIHRHESVSAGSLMTPHPLPDDYADTWYTNRLERFSLPTVLFWVITLRDSGEMIGDCGCEIVPRHRRAGIGYALHPNHWGQGLMTESLFEMCSYLFETHDPQLLRIEADHFPENTASERLLSRIGMRLEGTLRSYVLKFGSPRDLVRRSVLKDEFIAAKATYQSQSSG